MLQVLRLMTWKLLLLKRNLIVMHAVTTSLRGKKLMQRLRRGLRWALGYEWDLRRWSSRAESEDYWKNETHFIYHYTQSSTPFKLFFTLIIKTQSWTKFQNSLWMIFKSRNCMASNHWKDCWVEHFQLIVTNTVHKKGVFHWVLSPRILTERLLEENSILEKAQPCVTAH